MMRIMVPFLNLDPLTDQAVRQASADFSENHYLEFVHTPEDDPYAYHRELQARWGQGDDLVVIEQDIVIHEGVLPAFRDCNQGWCTFAYPLWDRGEWMYWCLGCVRYTAELQEQYPLIPHSIWFRLDNSIRDLFWRGKVWPHCHGTVEHTHADRGQDTPEAIVANLEKCPDPNDQDHLCGLCGHSLYSHATATCSYCRCSGTEACL